MALTVTITEEQIQSAAPDSDSLSNARGLVRKKSFQKTGVSADGTWLLADCKGSGKLPYQVSIDFADPNNPTFRCSCPSRKFPCKHGLGLLLAYVEDASSFGNREPSEDLVGKREKKQASEEKRKVGVPKKVNKAAQDKKLAAQREGLELLEKLLVDLVSAGQWFESSRLEKLERQAKQLNDAYLPATMYALRGLILLGKKKDISDDERMANASELIGRMWAIVQKGRNYLENKLAGDENQAEADAVIEDVLGKIWQLSELKEKGYFRSELHLLELGFERSDDESRQQRVEIGNMIDLSSGEMLQGISYRPFKGLSQIPEQPSFQAPVMVPEAAVYPGFLNRRVRWEKGSEQLMESSTTHLKIAYELAKPDLKTVLDAYRAQLKHPLAPREAVVLMRVERIGKIGEKIIIEDSAGARIEAQDKRKEYSNVANLVRAAGMLGKDHPALLLRLFLLPLPNTIVALPLAAITPKHHLRLGL